MPTGRNPDHMTADERHDEIASILAVGMLRAIRLARRSTTAHSGTRRILSPVALITAPTHRPVWLRGPRVSGRASMHL